MRSTGLGEKLNVEGFKRGRGNHAMPRARKKRGSTHLARLLIDHCFDGEESPNPDPQERKTYHQRNHIQQLNARHFNPPHRWNVDDEKPLLRS